MLKEFKEFAIRGNAFDLAVGVIIGAAFGKIIDSLVADIIMPIIGVITGGGVDFSNLYLALSSKVMPGLGLADARKLGNVLAYGNFLTIAINFLIIAFVLFLIVRQMNRMKKTEIAAPAAPPREEVLLEQIRDLLAKR